MDAIGHHLPLAVEIAQSCFSLLVGVDGVVTRSESLVGGGFRLASMEYLLVGLEGFDQTGLV